MTEKAKPTRGELILSEFKDQLNQRADSIALLLPKSISRDVFFEIVQTAVKANPSLLQCDRRSFFAACTLAARDGLLPDGREGALVPRKDTDNGIVTVAWQPMAYGIRKRAKETDGLILDAKCVYENDAWEHEEGDDAHIRHVPLPEWKGKRGNLVATYLIVRKFVDGKDHDVILHREVMYRSEVMAVKSRSKRPKADHWTIFEEEGWKKSAIHRGMKSVPCSAGLRETLSRDYDDFPYADSNVPLPPAATAPLLPPKTEQKPDAEPKVEEPETPELIPATFLAALESDISTAQSMIDVNDIWNDRETIIEKQLAKEDREKAYKIYDTAEARFKKRKAAS